MDIFTTLLTRVVPTPIKPTDLKVKALLKDAATGELKEDLDHVENHDYYFNDSDSAKDKKQQKESAQGDKEEAKQAKSAKSALANEKTTVKKDNKEEIISESADGTKHLDLYV